MARLTKKEIYANHGIVFDGDHIHSPIGLINELLKEGNTKTGKKVYTFSLLPTNHDFTIDINGKAYTVRGTCACTCKGCYATKNKYNTDGVIRSMAINTILVNEYLDFVKACISAQLEILKSGEIRIHAAGDFATKNPAAYAEMWHDTASKYTSFIYWTYTKVRKFESLFDDLGNANIVKSVIPNIGINFGHCDYILNTYFTLREIGEDVYICKCGFDNIQHCEGCKVCATYKYVLFLEHSTEYNAKKDPLYNKLKTLVMAQ